MKTKTILGLGVLFLTATISFVVWQNNAMENASIMLDADIDALAATECITSSGEKTGKCEEAVNGSGDVCVKSSWWERNDCVSHEEF